MISEELRKIKSFGSDRRSAVTEGDISQNEAELGFHLPVALQELYLCFHPDDPAFSEKGKLIPLEELRTYKRIYWTDTEVTIQAMEGQAVGLYDSEERSFWFVTRYEAAQERLEKMLGFSPED